jgi:AcrR family transcriptional regulator
MRERARDAGAGPRNRLTAAGLGYVAFAAANPALFGLMFASARPDFSNAALNKAASAAFQTLVDAVESAREGGGGPDLMVDATAAWAMAHGLAGLLLTGRSNLLAQAEGVNRETLLAEIFARVLPVQPKGGRDA